MEKYFKNSITLSELSHISDALYSDFIINTNYLKTDTGDVIAEVAELNFYLDNLDIYKDSNNETAKETYDHSKRVINRSLEYLKQYASQHTQNTGK